MGGWSMVILSCTANSCVQLHHFHCRGYRNLIPMFLIDLAIISALPYFVKGRVVHIADYALISW